MDGGLLHLGAMAVVVGLVYLNLDKINAPDDEAELHRTLQGYCEQVSTILHQRDEPWDSARIAIAAETRNVIAAAVLVCLFHCEVNRNRPRILARLDALAVTLRTIRRANLVRYVAQKKQPEYPSLVQLWFWIDLLRCAPALHIIRKKQYEIIVGVPTFGSLFAFFDQVACEVFDGKWLGLLPIEFPPSVLYGLYVATIMTVVLLTLAARRLEGQEPWDFIPRCERYLDRLSRVYEGEREKEQTTVDEDVDDFVSNW